MLALSCSNIVVNYYKVAHYVNNQVAIPSVNVLRSASANGFCVQFVETCHERLLFSCLGAENKACDNGRNEGIYGWMHMICGEMSDAMHGLYNDHSCDETMAQITICGVIVSQMHPHKAL